MSRQKIEQLLLDLTKEISVYCSNGGCIEIAHYTNAALGVSKPLHYTIADKKAEFDIHGHRLISFK